MLGNKFLMDAAALVNANEAQIAQLQSDINSASGCGICGYGRS